MGGELDTDDEREQTSERPVLRTREQLHEEAKAAFLASDGEDEDEEPQRSTGKQRADSARKPEPPRARGRAVGHEPPTVDDVLDDEADDDLDDEDAADAEDDLDDEADDDLDDEDAADAEDDLDPDGDEDEAADRDSDTARRMDKIRRAEQRMRESVRRDADRARAELTRERDAFVAEWRPKVAAAERFEQLRGRAPYEMVSVARELGVTDEHFERIGREFYAHSKGAADKPELREAAARAARERETADELATTRQKLAEIEKKLEERSTTEAADREVDAFLDRVSRVARRRMSDEAPLTKRYLETAPKEARATLETVAFELAQKLGRLPNTRAVIAAHEKSRREELKKLGIEAPAARPAGKSGKTKPPASDERPTKGSGTSPDPGRQYSRADFLREVERGALS